MIDMQIYLIRAHMLQYLLDSTQNATAQYLAEVIADQFISINKDNITFSRKVDVKLAALDVLPKYLEAGILGGRIYIENLTESEKLSLGNDYTDLVDAYRELERIRVSLCKY